MEKYATSAKVVDGILILTLPDALRPSVWQMQLGQTKSSALEVRDHGDQWLLVLKTPRQDVIEIAPFASREAALKALMAVSRAMEKAHGQLNGQASYSGTPTYPVPALIGGSAANWFYKIVKWFFYMVLTAIAFILIVLLALKLTAPTTDLQETAPQQQAAPTQDGIGTPQSAEDFLNGQ